MSILLGFEVPSGKRVEIPEEGHAGWFGQTQLSGKTTTFEAIVSRGKFRAMAFITKQGEGSFLTGHMIPPYFSEPTNDPEQPLWRWVQSILEASQNRKLRFEESWIISACDSPKQAKSLADVHANIQSLLSGERVQVAKGRGKNKKMEWKYVRKPVSGMNAGIYTSLNAYFSIVMPQLKRLPYTKKLHIGPGLNVMDLSAYSIEMQALVIRSVIEHVYLHERNVRVIIPEAQDFVPQGKNTPVKIACETLVRKGAALKNFMWLDSLPGYETLLVRVNGTVRCETFGSLFLLAGESRIGAKGEDVVIFRDTVEVPSQEPDRMRWSRVKGVLRHPYRGELLTVNTQCGVIDLSGNHPVLKKCQRRYEYVAAETLRIGNILSSRRFYEGPEYRQLADRHSLFVGSNQLAWFYGLFAAEGWISGKSVCIANSNMALLRRASAVLKEEFHLTPCMNSARLGVASVEVRSPLLAKHLASICYVAGGNYSSRTKKVPDQILNAVRDVQSSWLEGYYAGDGSHRRGGVSGCTSVSRPLLLGVLYLTRNHATVHIRPDKPDVIQLLFAGETRKPRSLVKKIGTKEYEGFLYDLVDVESRDHGYYAGVGNIRISNSQDMAAVDKVMVRGVSILGCGKQGEINEINRTIEHMLGGTIKAEDVARLPIGHFYLRLPDGDVKKVYVQPAWMRSEVHARAIAMGQVPASSARAQLDEYKKERQTDAQTEVQESSTDDSTAEGSATGDAGSSQGSGRPGSRHGGIPGSGSPTIRGGDEIFDGSGSPGASRDVFPGAVSAEDSSAPKTETETGYRIEGETGDAMNLISFGPLQENYALTPVLEAYADAATSQILTEEAVWKEKFESLEKSFSENFELLKDAHDKMAATMSLRATAPVDVHAQPQPGNGRATVGLLSPEDLYAYVRQRALRDPGLLQVLTDRPILDIVVKRVVIQEGGDTIQGELAQLIAAKFFDAPREFGAIRAEMIRRGFIDKKLGNVHVGKAIAGLVEMGFLTSEATGYQAVPGMKINIREEA